MKNIIVFILFCLPLMVQALTITSTSGGGSWFSTSTWVGGQLPGNTDDAVIAGNVTISTNVAVTRNLTINSGKTLTINSGILYLGSLTNNGTINGSGTQYPYTGTTITSTTIGGAWSSTSTWVGGVVPTYNDNVVIAGPVTTSTGVGQNCHNLTINSSQTFTNNSGYVFCYGKLTNNGTLSGTSGTIIFFGSGITVLSGSGTFSHTGPYYFESASPENDTIASNVTIGVATDIEIYTSILGPNVSCRVVNLGVIGITGLLRYGSVGAVWINGPNSNLDLNSNIFWSTTGDTLYASATGNTVIYNGGGAYNIKQPLWVMQ